MLYCTPFINYTYRLVMLQCNVTCKLEKCDDVTFAISFGCFQ